MSDLTTRLLAEIERREGVAERARTVNAAFHHPQDLIAARAYLSALREVVELHPSYELVTTHRRYCMTCMELGDTRSMEWPCSTIAAIAEALGVEG